LFEDEDDAVGIPTEPGDHRLPVIASTPTRGTDGTDGTGRSDRTRRAHAAPRPTRRDRREERRLRRRARRTVVGRHPTSTAVLVVLVLLTPVWISAGAAATNQGLGNSVGARLTEWVRDHGGGGLVTWAENVWYTWHAPPKGGTPPKGAIPVAASTTSTTVPTVPHLPTPPTIVPFVSDPQPGEGQWHPVGRLVDGIPAVYAAYLRPNDVNTSLVTGVAWMDTRLLSTTLYEGTQIPGTGQTWAHEAPIQGQALDTLVAAFNSGFRMQDAKGGFYADGITALPLVPDAASLVVYKNGDVTVGSWGSEVTMSPDVAAVRQNLRLVVDDGHVVPGLPANDNSQWGFTLGAKVQVWRSGLGVTADGALVYVGGSGLSIIDLANVLARAGCVRAMEMDINTDWVNFFYFDAAPGQPASVANASKLTADEEEPTDRYLSSAGSARDFITVSARPLAAAAVHARS
jgi:hypothetical protein